MSTVTQAAVTDDDVKLVLQRDKGTKTSLLSWSMEDLSSKGDGYTSDIKSIRVKYSVAGQPEESCYVAKIYQSKGKEEDYFFGLIFSKEVYFYTEVIPALNNILQEIGCRPLCFPKYFHHRLEEGNDMVILENLKEQSYQMKDKAIGVDIDHACFVLKELAKLHAASVLLQERHHGKEFTDILNFLQKEWSQEFNLGCDFGGFINNHLDIALAMFEKFGGCEKVINWLKRIKPDAWKIYNEQLVRTPPFGVIVHGDCWINNMLFRYDAIGNITDVRFLDLQGCRNASLATDLQHFITLNVTGPERHLKLSLLLSTYYSAFDEVMKAGGSKVPFSLEELRQEFINRGFYGVLYSIMYLPVMVRRLDDHIDVLNTESGSQLSQKENVLQMVDKNPLLKSRIMSVIEEWIEHGLIQ